LSQADSVAAQRIAQLRDFSTDPFTHVSGIVVRRIRNRDYLILDMRVLGNRTLSNLASLCCLRVDTVFDSILRYQNNRSVVRYLHGNIVGGGYPGHDRALRSLREEGQVISATNIGTGGRIVARPAYNRWELTVQLTALVTLPMSDQFRDRVVEHRLRVERDRFASTVIRRAEQEIASLENHHRIIEGYIQRRKSLLEPFTSEISCINTAKNILTLMLNHPHADDQPDNDDRSDVQTLLQNVIRLEEHANQTLLENPPGEAGNVLQLENAHARAVRLYLQSDEINRLANQLRSNPHLVTNNIYQRYCEAVGNTYAILLATGERDYILAHIVLPILNYMEQGDPSPTRALTVSFDSPTVLGTLLDVSALFPTVAGNLPGPQSIIVALLEAAGPALLGYALENPALAMNMSRNITRAVTWVSNLPDEEATRLMAAVSADDMVAARSVISSRFMNSPKWGALLGIINIAILVHAIQDTEADTVARWSTIVGSAAGSIISLHLLAHTLRVYRTSQMAGLMGGTLGKSLGVIAGIAAVVSGVNSAMDEAATGDQRGMWINLVGAGGAAMSVAGFLIAGGIGASATGAGAPIGLALVIIGGVIALVAGIVGLWRELTTAGSHRVFEAYINHLQREDGDFNRVINSVDRLGHAVQRLRSAYFQVRNNHHDLDFWDIAPDVVQALYDMIPNHEVVGSMVAMDEAEVRSLVTS
jgi:hypothetical protein